MIQEVANLGDEYMFGPSILVAPVTEQGRTSREVYLPAGTDWYNFWTNEKVHGRAEHYCSRADRDDSSLCEGWVDSAVGCAGREYGMISSRSRSFGCIRGKDADFELYSDDGTTYKYEKGDMQLTKLHWSEGAGKLTREGAKLDVDSEAGLVEVVGR